jgi:hypothetical protein
VVPQRVQRGNGKTARRTHSCLDELRQYQRGEVGNVLGEIAHRGKLECQFAQASAELRVEIALVREAAHIQRRKRDHPDAVLLGARQQELEVALLGVAESR